MWTMSGFPGRCSPPDVKWRGSLPPLAVPGGTVRPGDLLETRPLVIVEGSYSLRPDLRQAYGLRIWVEAPMPVREGRLALRGPGCLARFQNQWIPLEDEYFRACRVRDCCHFAISGENLLE